MPAWHGMAMLLGTKKKKKKKKRKQQKLASFTFQP